MAKTGLNIDIAQALKNLDQFGQAVKQHLPRAMAVEGGKILRDEAKSRAPKKTGNLARSIYLAYSDRKSNPDDGLAVYRVSWNSGGGQNPDGWYGRLVEFGHWRYNRGFGEGQWRRTLVERMVGKSTRKKKLKRVSRGRSGGVDHSGPGKLPKPEWVPAQPFLRPAYDAMAQTAVKAMLDYGQQRLGQIMSGVYDQSAVVDDHGTIVGYRK